MSIGLGLFLLSCSVVAIFLWVIFIKWCDESEKRAVVFGWTLANMTTLTIGVFVFAFLDKPITPIDVYRGKTTLEITYKDSIPIDSVVVWKEEIK